MAPSEQYKLFTTMYIKLIIKKIVAVIASVFSVLALAMPPLPDIPEVPVISLSGNTYHVNNINGNDTNDGSAYFPWASFKFATSQLVPGDKLIVHGSHIPYAMAWTDLVRSDTNTQWIAIEGRNGINGEKAIFTERLSFGSDFGESAAYILLKNILFQGEGGGGLNIVVYPNSHHLVFENIEIDCQSHAENQRAIWVNHDAHHLWFKNMSVHHCGYQRDTDENNTVIPTDCGGICVKEENIDEVVFHNVKVSYNVGDGISAASEIRNGNFYFKQCVSDNNTGDGYDMSGARVVFVNSISKNNGGHQGVGFKLWSKESWLVNIVAYNNNYVGASIKPRHDGQNNAYILKSTFAKNNIGRFGGQINTDPLLPSNGELHFYIINNIFHALNTSAILINNINTQTIKEESNNYYFSDYDESLLPLPHWSYEDAIQFRDGEDNLVHGFLFTEMIDAGRWNIVTNNGSGNIGETDAESGKSDPGFVNLNTGDLRLRAGSKAIDAGMVIKDIEFVGNPDIGAYEFIAIAMPAADADSDGIADSADNCTLVPNPAQHDTDADGYGNACDLDFNNDGIVNATDLAFFKPRFFTSDPDADLTGDGIVNAADLAILKTFFFKPPGPSALAP